MATAKGRLGRGLNFCLSSSPETESSCSKVCIWAVIDQPGQLGWSVDLARAGVCSSLWPFLSWLLLTPHKGAGVVCACPGMRMVRMVVGT